MTDTSTNVADRQATGDTDQPAAMHEKVRLEILRNRFQAIADEMAMVAYRTAHTVFVKETQDYACALVAPNGEIFAAPRRYGVLIMIGTPMDTAIRRIAHDVRAGDVFISNDPTCTGGMATHLPDIYLWKPIFYQGQLICYAWSFIHASDVGGRVPGSIAPSNYEIFQEGLRIPPSKLYREGQLDETILGIIKANCRIPEQNWGDLKALLSSLNTAERRLHGLLDQYTAPVVSQSIMGLLDYAEAQARHVIRQAPDGVYRYEDYMEGDQVGIGMVRIAVDMHIRGDDVLLDYSRTDPQVRAALNLYSGSKRGHWNIVVGIMHWLCTSEPEIAYNFGMLRPFEVRAPAGSLLNATAPAACGNRSGLQVRMTDVNLGALAQALPGAVPSFGPGQASIFLVSAPDFKSGSTKVSVIQPLIGGSGARPNADGVEGVDTIWNFLKNVPTEAIENEMPIVRVEHYSLRPDSGGAGRYRGGMGIELEVTTTSPYTVVTSRAMDRYVFAPPGRLGGRPGATGYTTLNPGSDGERSIGKIDVLELAPGERLRIGTQGGGGFGDPLERAVDAVALDIRKGLVTLGAARDVYGVVADEHGKLDVAATERLRQDRRASQPAAPPLFDFGPARDAYRRRWPVALEDAIVGATLGYSPMLRQFLHAQLKAEVETRLNRGEIVAPAEITPLVDAIAARYDLDLPPKQL